MDEWIDVDALDVVGATDLGCLISVTASSPHLVILRPLYLYEYACTSEGAVTSMGENEPPACLNTVDRETYLPPAPTAGRRLSSSMALLDTPRPLIVADGWASSRPSSEMACSGIGTPDCIPSRASDEKGGCSEIWAWASGSPRLRAVPARPRVSYPDQSLQKSSRPRP